jgi:protein tyrosine phosphatase (PTP) superfamily phosphohydrolase (DUF442 family)
MKTVLSKNFRTCRPAIAFLILGLPALASSVPGIDNFDQVDARVYRGGQPSADGFKYLAKIGVKTIIDLREADGRAQAEERMVTGAGMKYVNVPMTGLTPPTDSEITKILGLMEDGQSGPVFVHCKRGADRTGAVVAAYHIEHDNWDNAKALRDAKAHKMAFFQFPRQRYIATFRPRTENAKSATPAQTTTPAAAPAVLAPATVVTD